MRVLKYNSIQTASSFVLPWGSGHSFQARSWESSDTREKDMSASMDSSTHWRGHSSSRWDSHSMSGLTVLCLNIGIIICMTDLLHMGSVLTRSVVPNMASMEQFIIFSNFLILSFLWQ